MGFTDQLSTRSAIRKQLVKADVLGLTEMGLNREQAKTVELPGFTCIKMLARPHDPKHGGVAVFVKNRLAPFTTVCAEHDDLGIVWVQVSPAPDFRPVFVAFCYIPGHNSSAHNAKEKKKQTSIDHHFATFASDIVRFSALGEVVLMGDFNARVGRESEASTEEWADITAMPGIAVPPPVLAFSRLLERLGPRASCDKGTANSMGKKVLQMCGEHQLLILNGRVLGDEHGALTYFSRTGKGNTMIDLVITSPALVVGAEGDYRAGCHMHVTAQEKCPPRPIGGAFDHMPVSFTFNLLAADEKLPIPPGHTGAEPTNALKWEAKLQPLWVEALMSDTSVRACFDAILTSDEQSDGTHLFGLFHEAMTTAITALDSKCGGRLLHPKHSSRQRRVHKPWYDDECRLMRRQLREAETFYGDDSAEALINRKVYLNCVRNAKRNFEYTRILQMKQQIQGDPRSFWDVYKDLGTKPDGPSDMSQWTDYFKKLLHAIGTCEYVGGTLDSHCAHYAELFGLPSQEALDAAECLNAPVTAAEVGRVIHMLANHKASGVDGIPAEFYKNAYFLDDEDKKVHLLIPHLKRVFDAVLRGGYPMEWAVAALVPVPKPKADHSSCDGFRGIAVGLVVGKMYSMLLLGRMDAWAERQQARARGQAGFRAGRSTVDNIFILRHVINKYKNDKKPVYVAFIDFKKAYDCVDRGLLWRCLAKLGVHGATMNTLLEMHTDVQMRVRLNKQLGEGFEAGRGVRQGDPLSPLLFGIFIDRFESFLATRSEGGVKIGNVLLQLLLYADDLAILAESKEQLQSMLDILNDFCKATCMTVNVTKSEVVVFNTKKSDAVFKYQGEIMPVKDHFVYLGVRLDAKHVVGGVMELRVKKARAAMYAMFRRCYELGIHNLSMQGHLFDTLVKPVMNYGCEVWAAEQLSSDKAIKGDGPAELLHFAFLRQSFGVRKSTARAIMLTEAGCGFMNQAWIKQCLNFFNKMIARGADDLVHISMEEDLSLTRGGSKQTWSHHISTCIRRLNDGEELAKQFLEYNFCDAPLLVAEFGKLQMQTAWKQSHDDDGGDVAVRSIPDSEREGFKHATYQGWFKPEGDTVSGYLHCLHNRDNIKALTRYRMGSHSLGIETGRWCVVDGKRQCIPRSMRICKMCTDGQRDDEVHVLTCHAYKHLRCKHFKNQDYFDSYVIDDGTIRQTMNGQNWSVLASYILDVDAYRAKRELEMNSKKDETMITLLPEDTSQ